MYYIDIDRHLKTSVAILFNLNYNSVTAIKLLYSFK